MYVLRLSQSRSLVSGSGVEVSSNFFIGLSVFVVIGQHYSFNFVLVIQHSIKTCSDCFITDCFPVVIPSPFKMLSYNYLKSVH